MSKPLFPLAGGMNSIIEAHAASQPRFLIYEDSKEPKHKFRWHIMVSSDIVAASSQGYATRELCLENVKKVGSHIALLEKRGQLV